MKKTKKDATAENYNRIFKEFQLKNIFLKSAKIDLKERPSSEKGVKVDIKQTHSFEINAPRRPNVDYCISFIGKSGRKKTIEVTCHYVAEFSSKEEVNEEFMEIFAEMNIQRLCYPYAREFIQNMLVRMDLPSLTLPMVKIITEK